MVIKTIKEENFDNPIINGNNIPAEIKGEILILYELGLEEYEINYLIYLKAKERAKLKWGG